MLTYSYEQVFTGNQQQTEVIFHALLALLLTDLSQMSFCSLIRLALALAMTVTYIFS